jgi:predicted MFS family arabinose efflux permease
VISFGVFLKPISAEFGWDRSVLSAALTLAVLLNAVSTPTLGWLIDRYGVRRMTLITVTLFPAATAAMSLLSSSYLVLAMLFGIWGITSTGQSQVPYVSAISSTFVKNRGLALGVGLCGLGIGASLVPPVARWLIDNFGWRGAYLGLGLLSFIVAFSSVYFLVRIPRHEITQPGPSATVNRSKGALLKLITRSRHFWFILIPVFVMSLATNGAVSNVIPMLTDDGMAPAKAASYAALIGVATVVGKVSSGFFADRFTPQLVAAAYFLLPVLAYLLLILGLATQYPVFVMLSLGVALGAEVALAGTLVARFFGLTHFAQIFGFTAFGYSIGVGLGSLAMNAAFDRFGSYRAALIVFAISLIAAAAMIGSLRKDEELRRRVETT